MGCPHCGFRSSHRRLSQTASQTFQKVTQDDNTDEQSPNSGKGHVYARNGGYRRPVSEPLKTWTAEIFFRGHRFPEHAIHGPYRTVEAVECGAHSSAGNRQCESRRVRSAAGGVSAGYVREHESPFESPFEFRGKTSRKSFGGAEKRN